MGDDELKENAEKTMVGLVINGWEVMSYYGNGANGFCLGVKKNDKLGCMKIPRDGRTQLIYESKVLEALGSPLNLERRTNHIIRQLEAGRLKENNRFYFIMENAPDNPIDLYLNGRLKQFPNDTEMVVITKLALQMLRGLYDLHQIGYIYRDFKSENIGMPGDPPSVTVYDLGAARRFLEQNGNFRIPRSRAPFRGTDEWSPPLAELHFEQGPVDDIEALLIYFNENVNCRGSSVPQAWSHWGGLQRQVELQTKEMLHLLKSNFMGPSKFVLQNCHENLYKLRLFLSTFGRTDWPNHFAAATLINEIDPKIKRRNKNNTNKVEFFKEELDLLEHYFT